MTEPWDEPSENDGITLGPEEALEREIAKSKALKVERLQLRDQVERLTAENQALGEENRSLQQHLKSALSGRDPAPGEGHPPPLDSYRPHGFWLSARWAFFLLIFNLAAIGILLIFLLQKPGP